MVKSPVRENRPPGSVRGAPGNRRPYRDPSGGRAALGRRILAAIQKIRRLAAVGEA